MHSGVKKIESIGNMAVFHDFKWRETLNDIAAFSVINIIYGRNYSGKTTLSRIFRAMETGRLSERFDNPSFDVVMVDDTHITQADLISHEKNIRVFNEDFIRDNFHFIANPDDGIEPFAVLGDDNNKIEAEIHELESELGSDEEGEQTGLHSERIQAVEVFDSKKKIYERERGHLDKQLEDKSTNSQTSIRNQPERYGDQNYNIRKLRNEIGIVLGEDYQPLADSWLKQCEKLIKEETLSPISSFQAPSLKLSSFTSQAKNLITRRISESDKMDELLSDPTLNRWASEGRTLHKNKRDNCAFCGNYIDDDRWTKLDKHYDEEAEILEVNIRSLIGNIEKEKDAVLSVPTVKKELFYSMFHDELEELEQRLSDISGEYLNSLDSLKDQLQERQNSILTPVSFSQPNDVSGDLKVLWNSYEDIATRSDAFSNSLGEKQDQAKVDLRLKEVCDYLDTIRYEGQVSAIEELKQNRDAAEQEKNRIEKDISDKEDLLASKRRELNDEEKGAKKVNEYLNNFFGHKFLSLQALSEMSGDDTKHIHFEVVRDGKKAYHLSEGERSLLAFCYFLAKLEDVDTKDLKPIVWIDDPVSSLDSNHIFFVYSLINAELVSSTQFEQLFVSTHNLDFLKYLKRLSGRKKSHQGCFIVIRQDETSTIQRMPKYLEKYITEFNYLFHQIYKCARIDLVDDTNYTTFYNFGNNARKFLEIYLYYKYPDKGMSEETLSRFFGEDMATAMLTDRINNEYSHLCGVFERGSTPVEVPEMQTVARQIIKKLKEGDREQYAALLRSVESLGDAID